MTFDRKSLTRAIIVTLAVTLVSLLVWGFWPQQMLETIQGDILTESYIGKFNLAPMDILSAPVSLVIGLALMWAAFRRKDPPLAILGWLFFVPYIPFYQTIFLLLHANVKCRFCIFDSKFFG